MAAKKKIADTPAPEASTGPRPKYVLIAENRALAAATAEKDWGWEKTKAGWKDSAGNSVAFVAEIGALTKLASASLVRVYEGYKWYAAIAPHHLEALKKSGAVEVMSAPALIG